MRAERCPACLGLKVTMAVSDDLIWTMVDCQRCGTFHFNEESRFPLDTETGSQRCPALLGGVGSRQRSNLSGHIREHQGLKIERQDVDRLARLETPSLHKRADKLLEAIERYTNYVGQPVDTQDEKWKAIAWCLDVEYAEIRMYLTVTDRVRSVYPHAPNLVTITPNGWEYLEKLHETNPTSSEGFVAMRFSDTMFAIYEKAIAPAIRDAGYDPTIVSKFQPPAGTEGYTDDIVARILMLIRRSRFVVADFTEPSDGVYFEAGFARGLGRHVIWTRRKGAPGKPHFDTDHFDHIMWTDETMLRRELTARIEAQLGRGPRRPNGSDHGAT